VAYELEMVKGIGDAGTLGGQDLNCPGLKLAIAAIAGNAVDDFKGADDDVVRIGQIDEILPLLACERVQKLEQISGGNGFEGQLEKCVYVLLFTLNYIGHETRQLPGFGYLFRYDESCRLRVGRRPGSYRRSGHRVSGSSGQRKSKPGALNSTLIRYQSVQIS